MAKTPLSQLELELSSMLSHAIFPGRSALKLQEVAKAWAVTDQHVINLIEVGDLTAIDFRTSKKIDSEDMKQMKAHRILRSTIRIPVSAFDEFVKARRTDT